MIIDLTQSQIFTTDPDVRFAKEYSLPKGVWLELWRRYTLLEYSNGDLRDFLFVKHLRNLHYNSMARWIIRSEVYSIANPLIKKGVRHVNTGIFKDHEEYVIKELVKPIKYGSATESKIII